MKSIEDVLASGTEITPKEDRHRFVKRMDGLFVRCAGCGEEYTRAQLKRLTLDETKELDNGRCPGKAVKERV